MKSRRRTLLLSLLVIVLMGLTASSAIAGTAPGGCGGTASMLSV